MGLSTVATGALTLALGVVPLFSIYLIVMGLVGIAVPLFSTPSTVLLQEKIEEGFLGRVFGIQVMISTSMMPLGMLVFGPMADVIAIESMLIVTGVLLFIQGFLLLRSKTMLVAGEPASTPVPD
jgi:DHA3 family macrolide efflux protein-like MFS transporter